MITSTASPRLLAPVRLPQRLDGTRLDHLSASSLALFWRCAESWRVRYVRGRESAELRRGWVVDAVIEAYYKPCSLPASRCRSTTSRTSTPPHGSAGSTTPPSRSTGATTRPRT